MHIQHSDLQVDAWGDYIAQHPLVVELAKVPADYVSDQTQRQGLRWPDTYEEIGGHWFTALAEGGQKACVICGYPYRPIPRATLLRMLERALDRGDRLVSDHLLWAVENLGPATRGNQPDKTVPPYHTCKKCLKTKPVTREFWRRETQARHGYRLTECKMCRNARNRWETQQQRSKR